jgi:hypothetical protein
VQGGLSGLRLLLFTSILYLHVLYNRRGRPAGIEVASVIIGGGLPVVFECLLQHSDGVLGARLSAKACD